MNIFGETSRVIAVSQITLSILFLTGYFAALAMFLFGWVWVAPVWRDQLGIMLGVLTAGVMNIIQFWFSRNREKVKEEDSNG